MQKLRRLKSTGLRFFQNPLRQVLPGILLRKRTVAPASDAQVVGSIWLVRRRYPPKERRSFHYSATEFHYHGFMLGQRCEGYWQIAAGEKPLQAGEIRPRSSGVLKNPDHMICKERPGQAGRQVQ